MKSKETNNGSMKKVYLSKRAYFLSVLLIFMTFLLISCGKAKEKSTLSPSGTVGAFYKAINKGDFSKAENYLGLVNQ